MGWYVQLIGVPCIICVLCRHLCEYYVIEVIFTSTCLDDFCPLLIMHIMWPLLLYGLWKAGSLLLQYEYGCP